MQKRFYKKILLVILLTWFTGVAMAATPNPVSMLKSTTDSIIAQLRQQKPNLRTQPQIVYRIIRTTLLPKVDKIVMARNVLGRDVWLSSNQSQRQRFIDEFITSLIRTYATALTEYDNETVQFPPMRGGYEGKTRMQVESFILQSGGPRITLSYRIILSGNAWRIYDISVDNVSLTQSFKAQFASQIQQYGMEKFLQNLKEHNTKLANQGIERR